MPEINFNPELNPQNKPDSSVEKKEGQENNSESNPEKREVIKENIDKSEQVVRVQAETSSKKKSKNSVVTETNFNSDQARQLKEIDDILSEGLEDVFLALSSEKQANFKQVGEETKVKINILLQKTQIKVEQIVNLIKKWLGIIPSVNYYYLEQEAKIKADKIMKLKK